MADILSEEEFLQRVEVEGGAYAVAYYYSLDRLATLKDDELRKVVLDAAQAIRTLDELLEKKGCSGG